MHIFDRDIAFVSSGPLLLTGRISDNWSINETPNGGYLLALVAHAMMAQSQRQATPIITANFLRRCRAGEAQISVENISRSRQFDRMQARLFQGGEERIRAFGTLADATSRPESGRRYETLPPDVPPADRCLPVPAMPGYSLFDHLDVRLDPRCAGWMEGRLVDRSEHTGRVRFKDRRAFDTAAALLIADAFPPPVFASQGAAAWVPTLELSVNVRNGSASGWLVCRFRTRFINNGLLEEDGEIWDESGELVAVSRQVAQFQKTDA